MNESGYEQAFLERPGCTAKGEVFHAGESEASDFCGFYEWEDTVVRYKFEVSNQVFKG